MTLQRIDQMTVPPIVGRFYLVPTVKAEYCSRVDHWPVIGPRHTDVEFFQFEAEHYHVDGRFLTYAQRRRCATWGGHYRSLKLADVVDRVVSASPLQTTSRINEGGLPKPEWTRRRCWSSRLSYPFADHVKVQNLQSHFAGQQCAHGRNGWVCPHQKAALGSIEPVDGVITCPLHGLRIDAASGRVLDGEAAS